MSIAAVANDGTVDSRRNEATEVVAVGAGVMVQAGPATAPPRPAPRAPATASLRPAPGAPPAAGDRRVDLDAVLHDTFARMAACPAGSAERARLRAEAIELALPLVSRLARRFRGRGESPEDLRQSGALALVKAVDNYDPARCVPFTGYVIPCLIGAFKRHFRDNGWDLRVPRPLQERQREIEHTAAELTQRLRRSPTPDELAATLGMTTDDVIMGLAARQAYDAVSLNEPVGDEAGGGERQDALGGPDVALEEAADRISLGPLLQRLPERERIIVTRRFFGNLSQSEIAAELGISQMQVSRILTQVLGWLRGVLRDDEIAIYPGATVDQPLSVRVAVTGTTLVAAVHGAVDAGGTQYLRTRLVKAVVGHRPRQVVVDLHEVPAMTTAGAAVLVAARSACGHVGAGLRLARVSPPVARVLERTGVSALVRAGTAPRPAYRAGRSSAGSLVNRHTSSRSGVNRRRQVGEGS